jgi:hypothetical protein
MTTPISRPHNVSAASDWESDMRRELKCLLPLVRGRTPAMLMASRAPSLTVAFPPRQVSSVYFDSASYECYRLSNSGMSQRMKLRLRWYGDLRTNPPMVLEVKHRVNHLGSKSRHRLDRMDIQDKTWHSIRAEMSGRLQGPDRLIVEALRFPILIATYYRHYFVTTDGSIRVTVDTNLRIVDQRFSAKPNFTFDSVQAKFEVLECKFDPSQEPEAFHLLRPLDLRWTRFSKYCFGLGALTRR